MAFQLRRLNLRVVKFYCTVSSSCVNSVEVPKKSLRQKWFEYLKIMATDYKDVFVDFGKTAMQHPLKSGAWLAIFSSCLVCRSLNPDEKSYRENIIQKSNELIFVSKSIRNPEAEEYLHTIESYYNRDQILRLSFGLFSVILHNFKSSGCSSFRENCTYIQPTYAEILRERIIDIGFLNKWWIFERKMHDFDVNPNEWNDINKE